MFFLFILKQTFFLKKEQAINRGGENRDQEKTGWKFLLLILIANRFRLA